MPIFKIVGGVKLIVFDKPDFQTRQNKLRIVATSISGKLVYHSIKNLKTKEIIVVEQKEMHSWDYIEDQPIKKRK